MLGRQVLHCVFVVVEGIGRTTSHQHHGGLFLMVELVGTSKVCFKVCLRAIGLWEFHPTFTFVEE